MPETRKCPCCKRLVPHGEGVAVWTITAGVKHQTMAHNDCYTRLRRGPRTVPPRNRKGA